MSRSSLLLPSHFRMMCPCLPAVHCFSFILLAHRSLMWEEGNRSRFLLQQWFLCSSSFFLSKISSLSFAGSEYLWNQNCASVSQRMVELV
uniref:Uncharacterized protein n=1 Tax=Arundo donax TaxID=35708 RepID=A0A0A9FX37_ARUDO